MRFSRIALLAFTLASLSSPLHIHASQQSSSTSTSSRTISFHTHSIDTRHVMHVLDTPIHADDHKKQPFLIQLEEGEEMMQIKEQIEQYLGHALLHYYPDNAWVTYIPPLTARTIATSIPGIAWVGAYSPTYKLHGSIYNDDTIIPDYGDDLIGQFFANQTELSKQNQVYAINVHLHAEDSSDIYRPRDLDSTTEQQLHTLIRTWMSEHNQPTYEDAYDIHSRHMMTIRVKDQASLRSLSELIAKHPRVHYIERHYPNTPQNAWAKQISQTNSSPIPLTMIASKLTGAGEVIGMIDTGVDHASCFLYDPSNPQGPKVTKYERTDKPQVTASGHRKIAQLVQFSGDVIDDHGHGTHLAGTLVGQALATGGELSKFNGLAPDAKLAVFDAGQQNEFVIPRPLDVYMLPYAAKVGAAIHLNAWGNANPDYDSTAEEFDRYQFYHPEFLAVVAAGNNGQAKITSPGTSKNSLVVGATIATKDSFTGLFCANGIFQNPQLCKEGDTTTPNSVAPFSSRGPTKDLRIKPDVVTTGMYVASAKNAQTAGASCTAPMNDVLKTRGGTSSASSIIAANAALIRQYFRDGYYPSGTPTNPKITPSASLVKAILINGAMPASNVPNAAAFTTADQGFGRSVLADALPLFGAKYSLLMKRDVTNALGDPYFTKDNVATPQTLVFCGSPSTTEEMKVTLVYADAPADPNAGGNNLINNLDLELDASPGFARRLGNEGTTADVRNNVEQIIVKPGTLTQRLTFTATVFARKIVTYNNLDATKPGQLPYSLIVTGNVVMGACAAETPTNPPVNPTTTAPGQPTSAPNPGQPTTGTQPTSPVDPNEFFAWIYGDFSMCSVACATPGSATAAGGTQSRTVTCKSTTRGNVADSDCISVIGPKPQVSRPCNTNPCTGVQYEWKLGTWSACSKPCDGGKQTRDVTCQTIATATQSSVPVDPAKCADHVKPITEQACNTIPCMGGNPDNGGGGRLDDLFDWRASVPGPCSKPCDGGVALRTVLCFIGEISVDEKYCMGLIKPSSTIACNTNPCIVTPPPNTPATPRPGTGAPPATQTPPATQAPPATVSPTGPVSTGPVINTTIPDPDANPVIPPSFTGNLPVPVPQTFQWQVYDYGPCSVGCSDTNAPDGGIQTRVVKCRSSLGNFDDDARCAPVPKPPVSKTCNADPCPTRDDVNLEWVTGMWGTCDVDTRVQTRWLVCKDTNNRYVDFQQCQSHVGPLPATTQPCIPNAGSINEWQTKYATPVYSWYAQRFGDCSVWCNGPGKQTRGLHCLAPMGIVATSQDQCRNDPAAGVEPSKEQTCGAQACASSPQWYGGDFISCTDPDPCLGTESRHVFCIGTDGKKLTDTAACKSPQIPFTRSPCGACVPKEQMILGLKSSAVIGIAIALGIIALIGVAYLALQWRRRIRDQHNKVASRIALSKV